jgi:CubicO group peptidase (beta-lactamase class C family)
MYATGSFPWNDRATHAAEIPGAGAIAAPRSMARLYALLVGTDEQRRDGRVLSPETVAVARAELSRGTERWLGRPLRFGAGYALQGPGMQFGPPADAFGHPGAGGSLHGAWPQERVAFSYAMNLMREGEESGGGRGTAVLAELHRSITESGL